MITEYNRTKQNIHRKIIYVDSAHLTIAVMVKALRQNMRPVRSQSQESEGE